MIDLKSQNLIKNICIGCDVVAAIDKNDLSLSIIHAKEDIISILNTYGNNSRIHLAMSEEMIDDDDFLKFKEMIDPKALRSLKDGAKAEGVIKLKNGSYKKIIISSFVDEDYLIVKIIDTTSSKKDLALKNTILSDSINGTYTLAVFINLETDLIAKIVVENEEVIVKNYDVPWSKVYEETLKRIHPDDLANFIAKTHPAYFTSCPIGTNVKVSYRIINRGYSDYRYFNTQFFVHENGSHQRTMVVLLIDKTKTIMEKKELIKISERDNLTYLYNRSKLDNMIETEYVNLRCCGILFFDINNLKEINDCLGHNEGDECIIRAAEAIRSITNRSIHAYRYGGDEFIVVAVNINQNDLDHLISLVLHRLKYLNSNKPFECKMAAGKSWSDSDIDIKYLITLADFDMYKQKKEMKKAL